MKRVTKEIHDNALAPFVFSDEGGKHSMAESLTRIADAHARYRAIMFAAEFAYRMANPESKMDVPSIVYEQTERTYDQWVVEQDAKDEVESD